MYSSPVQRTPYLDPTILPTHPPHPQSKTEVEAGASPSLAELPQDSLLAQLKNRGCIDADHLLVPGKVVALDDQQPCDLSILFQKINMCVETESGEKIHIKFSFNDFFTYLSNNSPHQIQDIQLLGESALSLFPKLAQKTVEQLLGKEISPQQDLKKPINTHRARICFKLSSLDLYADLKTCFTSFLEKKAGFEGKQLRYPNLKIDLPFMLFFDNSYAKISIFDETKEETHLYEFIFSQKMGNPTPFSISQFAISLQDILKLPNFNTLNLQGNDKAPAETKALLEEVKKKALSSLCTLNKDTWVQTCVDHFTGCLRLDAPTQSNAPNGWLYLMQAYVCGQRPVNFAAENQLLKAFFRAAEKKIDLPEEVQRKMPSSGSLSTLQPWQTAAIHYFSEMTNGDFNLTIALLVQTSLAFQRCGYDGYNTYITPLWSAMGSTLNELSKKQSKSMQINLWREIYEVMAQDFKNFDALTTLLEMKAFLMLTYGKSKNSKMDVSLCLSSQAPAIKITDGTYHLFFPIRLEETWENFFYQIDLFSNGKAFEKISLLIDNDRFDPSDSSSLHRNQSLLAIDYERISNCIQRRASYLPFNHWKLISAKGMLACNSLSNIASSWSWTKAFLTQLIQEMSDSDQRTTLIRATLKDRLTPADYQLLKDTPVELFLAKFLIENIDLNEPFERDVSQVYALWNSYRKVETQKECDRIESGLIQKMAQYKLELAMNMLRTLVQKRLICFTRYLKEIISVVVSVCENIRKDPPRTATNQVEFLKEIAERKNDKVNNTIAIELCKSFKLATNEEFNVYLIEVLLDALFYTDPFNSELLSLLKEQPPLMEFLLEEIAHASNKNSPLKPIYLEIFLKIQGMIQEQLTNEEHKRWQQFDQMLFKTILEDKAQEYNFAFYLKMGQQALVAGFPLLSTQAALLAAKEECDQKGSLAIQSLLLNILDSLKTNQDRLVFSKIIHAIFNSPIVKALIEKDSRNFFDAITPHFHTLNTKDHMELIRLLLRTALSLCSKFEATPKDYHDCLPLLRLSLEKEISPRTAFFHAIKSVYPSLLQAALISPEDNKDCVKYLNTFKKSPQPSLATSKPVTEEELTTFFYQVLKGEDPSLQTILDAIVQKSDGKMSASTRLEIFFKFLDSTDLDLDFWEAHSILFHFSNTILDIAQAKNSKNLLHPAVEVWKALFRFFSTKIYEQEDGTTWTFNDFKRKVTLSGKSDYLNKYFLFTETLLKGFVEPEEQFNASLRAIHTIAESTAIEDLIKIFKPSFFDNVFLLSKNRSLAYIDPISNKVFNSLKLECEKPFASIPTKFLNSFGKHFPQEKTTELINTWKGSNVHARNRIILSLLAGLLSSDFKLSPQLKNKFVTILKNVPSNQAGMVKDCLIQDKGKLHDNEKTEIWVGVLTRKSEEASQRLQWNDEFDYFLADFFNLLVDDPPRITNPKMLTSYEQSVTEIVAYFSARNKEFPQDEFFRMMEFLKAQSRDQSSQYEIKIYCLTLTNLLGQYVQSPQSLENMLTNSLVLLEKFPENIHRRHHEELKNIFDFLFKKSISDFCFNEKTYSIYTKTIKSFLTTLHKKGVIKGLSYTQSCLSNLTKNEKFDQASLKPIRQEILEFLKETEASYKKASEQKVSTAFMCANRLGAITLQAIKDGIFVKNDLLFFDMLNFLMKLMAESVSNRWALTKMMDLTINIIQLKIQTASNEEEHVHMTHWIFTCCNELLKSPAIHTTNCVASLLLMAIDDKFIKINDTSFKPYYGTLLHLQNFLFKHLGDRQQNYYVLPLLSSLFGLNADCSQNNKNYIDRTFEVFKEKLTNMGLQVFDEKNNAEEDISGTSSGEGNWLSSSLEQWSSSMEQLDFIMAYDQLFQEIVEPEQGDLATNIFDARAILFSQALGSIPPAQYKEALKRLSQFSNYLASEVTSSKLSYGKASNLWNSLKEALQANVGFALLAKDKVDFYLNLQTIVLSGVEETNSDFSQAIESLSKTIPTLSFNFLEKEFNYISASGLFKLCSKRRLEFIQHLLPSLIDKVHTEMRAEHSFPIDFLNCLETLFSQKEGIPTLFTYVENTTIPYDIFKVLARTVSQEEALALSKQLAERGEVLAVACSLSIVEGLLLSGDTTVINQELLDIVRTSILKFPIETKELCANCIMLFHDKDRLALWDELLDSLHLQIISLELSEELAIVPIRDCLFFVLYESSFLMYSIKTWKKLISLCFHCLPYMCFHQTDPYPMQKIKEACHLLKILDPCLSKDSEALICIKLFISLNEHTLTTSTQWNYFLNISKEVFKLIPKDLHLVNVKILSKSLLDLAIKNISSICLTNPDDPVSRIEDYEKFKNYVSSFIMQVKPVGEAKPLLEFLSFLLDIPNACTLPEKGVVGEYFSKIKKTYGLSLGSGYFQFKLTSSLIEKLFSKGFFNNKTPYFLNSVNFISQIANENSDNNSIYDEMRNEVISLLSLNKQLLELNIDPSFTHIHLLLNENQENSLEQSVESIQ